MLIVRKTERNAMRAAFAANRDRLFGGQHRYLGTSLTQRAVIGSIPSICKSQGLEPSAINDWRGG